VTLGYFESQSAAKTAHPGLPLIRRWTGGGVVVHGQDTPYSLIVPQDEPFARVRPAVAYSLLHGALAEALRSRIPGVTLATECTPGRGADCFDNPVPADLLWQGRKIGGAGQRRTRFGLLHQGTLQAGRDLFAEVRLFAKKLTDRVEKYALTKQTLALAERHFETRYNLDSWNGDKRGS
jgi:lipoate-protein ligase A